MTPLIGLTLVLLPLGLVLMSYGQERRGRGTVRRRFTGIACLALAVLLAIVNTFRSEPFALKLTPSEDQIRLAGAWQLGRDLAASLPPGQAPVLLIYSAQDSRPGPYGQSLLNAFQQGAGGPNPYDWQLFEAESLNHKLGFSHSPASLIEVGVIHGASLAALLNRYPKAAAVVFLHGLPPPEELGDVDALAGLYPEAGQKPADEIDVDGLPPFYALDNPSGLQPLLQHQVIKSLVYINPQAVLPDIHQQLSLEQAAQRVWISTSDKR